MAGNFVEFLRLRTQRTEEAGRERDAKGLMRGALRCNLDDIDAFAIGPDGFNIVGTPLHEDISDGVSEFSAGIDSVFAVSDFGSERSAEDLTSLSLNST